MADRSSILAIDEKMASMRLKNLELLRRHQEIEEDRQLARQSTEATDSAESSVTTKMIKATRKNRLRPADNQSMPEGTTMPRATIRQEMQTAPRYDHNHLKRERTRDVVVTPELHASHSNRPALIEYAYPFHSQRKTNHDADEPAQAKKLVVVNNQAGRIGSGRFLQQQQQQQPGQRKREERMRRCAGQNPESQGGSNEFHLDIAPVPMWHNSSIAPVHVQLLPPNINGHHHHHHHHHAGIEHLINNNGEQMEQAGYHPNYVYPSQGQPPTPFNGNGTIYFAHPHPSSMNQGPPPPPPAHFHPFHPTRTFENSNRQQFTHLPHFSPSNMFQPSTFLPPSNSSMDGPPRFRHVTGAEQEHPSGPSRPISGDFERLGNSSQPRSNQDQRFHSRPKSTYEFSSGSNPINHRYPRNNHSLPLSAYMNADDSSNSTAPVNYEKQWNTSYQRRRGAPQRLYNHDKHQFPLSSYDPRQYGFNNNSQRRQEFTNRGNTNRRPLNNSRAPNSSLNDSNDIDLIEEWWEDDNNTQLIGTKPTTLDDSGHSSLSASLVNISESTSNDAPHSTTDNHILQSLAHLQEQLQLEEAVDQCLTRATDHDQLISSMKESGTYNTAHFMQWAKKKFREELAGRLTAQEIQQHDAVTTDNDDDLEHDSIDAKIDLLPDVLHRQLNIDLQPTDD